ncbi:DUF3131 domain-containing protein [Meridianimarinicoccus aquatilis]|uniref:DUF3131 domain-containing protein n=1 Tax=Meridianimarinicoccus aquatilis TaxID=2552766 RepID=A0A4V3BCD8_9RHOB|nr:DUF3131 domain-containing protein [Fluviibacterium aquatile]TDL90489.1 DUF3131 domain-containing protein [Fluviibacterium aquatile]
MDFKTNLARARGHIIFVLALICGFALVVYLDGLEKVSLMPREEDPMSRFDEMVPLPLAITGSVTPEYLDYARTAWRYFENNTDPVTGLAGSADKYPSTTMWETGSYLIATVSAERLAIVSRDEAAQRIAKVIESLGQMVLFEDSLPNKAYDTRSLQMVDYGNNPTTIGLGWSALDVARVVAALVIVQHNYPEQATAVEDLFDLWDLDRVVREGELIGTNVSDGVVRENQEGRVGYEQYAAKAMMLLGYDASMALEVRSNLMVKDVEGVPIPVDTRLNRNKVPALTTSEPYLFDGLEFGFDTRSRLFGTAVYRAQELRYRKTGILTAVSEGHITVEPYFAYASVWGGGQPWAVLTFQGDRADSRRTLSTKAAFGWDALFATDYTSELVDAIVPMENKERGWPEGIYENGGEVNDSYTANTNAVVLASIAFRADGPLMRDEK